MSGRYTFFVAAKVPKVELSLCSVGVFGNRYTRPTDPQSSITLDSCLKSFSLDHVHEEIASGVQLAINLRQKTGSELKFVSITNSSTSATVTIDAKGIPSIPYSLVLESVDKNSSLPDLTLKTDTITF